MSEKKKDDIAFIQGVRNGTITWMKQHKELLVQTLLSYMEQGGTHKGHVER